jgi:accessory gene regulator protein AgrB
MYAQLAAPTTVIPNNLMGFQKCLVVANWTLIVSVLLLCLTIAVSFIFHRYFSMESQILAHVGTIVVAGVLKVGYVLRCVALNGLGEKV